MSINLWHAKLSIRQMALKFSQNFFFVTIVDPTYCGWFIKMMLVVNLCINNVDSITSYFNLRNCEKKGSNKIMFPLLLL